MTRLSFTGQGWRGIEVYPSILRARSMQLTGWIKSCFHLWKAQNPPWPTLAVSGVLLAWHPRSRSLPSPAHLQSTGPHSRGQPNKEEWATVTATRYLKTHYIVDKKGLKQADLFPNQLLVMSSSYICISRMFYALFFFEQVRPHLRALAEALS